MERFDLPGGRITLTLVKNPTGFNQVLQTVLSTQAERIKLLIIINDLAADGRDISWLWDVQFEILGEHAEQIQEIICSGLRAEDMALRLKYAGVPVEKLKIVHTVESAIEELQTMGTGEETTFIFPTYTALFPVRKILEKMAIKEEPQVRREKSEA
jgi:UDP-N-acetylmuramyl tripeptide synthase